MAKKKDEGFKITATEKGVHIINANPVQLMNVACRILEVVAERTNHKLETSIIIDSGMTLKLIPNKKELGSKNEAEKQGECNG